MRPLGSPAKVVAKPVAALLLGCDEMLGYRRFVAGRAQEPAARGVGIGERFLSGEGLRGDNEKRRFGATRFSVSTICVPSTLDTNCILRCGCP